LESLLELIQEMDLFGVASLRWVVFVALLVLIRFPSVPQWLLKWLLNCVELQLQALCLLTMAFLFQPR
jgi:hypothetical protein